MRVGGDSRRQESYLLSRTANHRPGGPVEGRVRLTYADDETERAASDKSL